MKVLNGATKEFDGNGFWLLIHYIKRKVIRQAMKQLQVFQKMYIVPKVEIGWNWIATHLIKNIIL